MPARIAISRRRTPPREASSVTRLPIRFVMRMLKGLSGSLAFIDTVPVNVTLFGEIRLSDPQCKDMIAKQCENSKACAIGADVARSFFIATLWPPYRTGRKTPRRPLDQGVSGQSSALAGMTSVAVLPTCPPAFRINLQSADHSRGLSKRLKACSILGGILSACGPITLMEFVTRRFAAFRAPPS